MRSPLLPWLLTCVLGSSAAAQGVGIPSSRWGVGFGNSPEFTGLRFNFRDHDVRRVTGINLTLWQPRGDQTSTITGLSVGPVPGGGTLRGLQVGLLGIVGTTSAIGVSLATLGMGAGGDLVGVNVAGLGMGAGKRLAGLNVAGLGLGAGERLEGLSLALLGMGAGTDIRGISIAGLGVGAGGDVYGITIGGLGAGAGGRMVGFNFGGLGLGAGRGLTGINLAGIALGSGTAVNGLSIAGLAAGAPLVRGLTMAVGVVGGQTLLGVHIAGASVHVTKGGRMVGAAISAFNYIRGTQTGVAIGVVNYAWSVRGVQIGLVNIVRDNPAPLMVLPVLNSSF